MMMMMMGKEFNRVGKISDLIKFVVTIFLFLLKFGISEWEISSSENKEDKSKDCC